MNDWFGTLPHKTKIVIAGNHDIGLDIEQYDAHVEKGIASSEFSPVENRKIMSNMTMLYNESI